MAVLSVLIFPLMDDELSIPKAPGKHLSPPAPIAKFIDLRLKGLSYREIAAIIGCSEANVSDRLQPYLQSITHLDAIKRHRADTLAVVGDTVLSSLSGADIRKASGYQKIGMYGILYDKERLERGQSSVNISVVDLTQSLAEITQQREELEAQVGLAQQELSSLTSDSEVIDV